MSKIIPIVVDVGSDGPYPPDYSMVCFGACVVEQGFSRTFKGNIRPISPIWNPDALKVSGISRDMHLCFPSPEETMVNFSNWLQSMKGDIDDNLSFWSDNPAYDWQFMNYYLWKFTGNNPFGYSARRIVIYILGHADIYMQNGKI